MSRDSLAKARLRRIHCENENKHYNESYLFLTNSWKSPRISRFFAVFAVWAMNKCCTMAVCRNGSKKKPDISINVVFPWGPMIVRSGRSLCKPAYKKFKRVTDPRIFSLHFKEPGIAISIFGRKNVPWGCYPTSFDRQNGLPIMSCSTPPNNIE